MRYSSLRSDRLSPQLDDGSLKCLNTTDQRMLQFCWPTHLVLIIDVKKIPKGESSNDRVFQISNPRNIGYSLGHIDITHHILTLIVIRRRLPISTKSIPLSTKATPNQDSACHGTFC